jgi:uncharacterized protein YbbC (DUF1343 family)
MKYLYYQPFLGLLFTFGIFFFLTQCTTRVPTRPVEVGRADMSKPKATEIVPQNTLKPMRVGAGCMDDYLNDLKGKRVALIVNHTALVGNTHLVDTLKHLGISIQKVFAPEHGFRGRADAGEHLSNSVDSETNIPIVSLYGKNYKPTPEQLADVDIVIFDIQDVGVRFYTYISTLHYAMEACAENDKRLIVLDRPNPNGSYIDGPIRELKFKSFVGMHPIPVVHGLTVGELSLMINGEKWLKDSLQCNLKVVRAENYSHNQPYSLPARPSPNLPNDLSIQLYPSLCFFEGTNISIGRGTEYPFQVMGAPQKNLGRFTFMPRSIDGMSKNPMYKDQLCHGVSLRDSNFYGKFTLYYLLKFYNKTKDKKKFFNGYFDTLAGTATLRQQIQSGFSEREIRRTWQAGLDNYKVLREKYLLYP